MSVSHLIVVVVVAVAYLALAALSAAVAYAPADAWTVWLASGMVFGALLVLRRPRWAATLAGGFIGATVFALYLGSSPLEAIGYGAIELVAAYAAAFAVSRLTSLPLQLNSARELGILILAGALPLALIGACAATVWHIGNGGATPGATFRVWALSNFIGTLLVAPVIISWAQFRVRRSGGMPMQVFAAGAVACILFLGSMWFLFDADVTQRFSGTVGQALTYEPIVLMALVAVLWGTPGATLTALAGALIAMVNTAQGQGPFAGVEGYLGEAELEVEGYALAIALTGLLIAVLVAAQRRAVREARDWKTRFEAAIAAHRLLTYEWDPASNRMIVTGDSNQFVGVPSTQLATLADWLALVPANERERVATRFDERVQGHGESDAMTYSFAGAGGSMLAVSDEARAIRDHDGQLHRIVGIARVAPTAVVAAAA